MNWTDLVTSKQSVALCLTLALSAGGALTACGDNTNPSSIEERAAAAQDGSIRIANRSFPGPDNFEAIGTPHDSLDELQSTESCFGEAAVTDPRVTTRNLGEAGFRVEHTTPVNLARSVNDIVRSDFHLEDPVTQLDLPYLRAGESVASVISYDYRETTYVSADWDIFEEGNYNAAVCGSEESPLTLSEFASQCGDTYTSGALLGGFVWVFAVHPTMSADELTALRDDFEAEERGGLLEDAENMETLVDLGFDVRVYSYGFPDSVTDPAHTPGTPISADEAYSYAIGGGALGDSVAAALNAEPAWPHDQFGAVLGQGQTPYRRDSMHACTGLDYRSELSCYYSVSLASLSEQSDWREYLQTAEQRLANSSQFDWGYDPEGVQQDYRTFVKDVRSCIERTDGLWSDCRAQVDATPTDTDAICSSCALRYNCDPMSSDPEQCAGDPERERFECDASAFDSEWERLFDRVRPDN